MRAVGNDREAALKELERRAGETYDARRLGQIEAQRLQIERDLHFFSVKS